MSRLVGRSAIFLVIFSLVGAIVSANDPPVNLIPNPSFEMGTGSGNVPLHWSVFASSDVAFFELTSEHASNGSTSLKLVDTAGDQSTGLRSTRVKAEPGRVYRAEANVLVQSGLTQFFLDFHDASGRRIVAEIGRGRVSPEWQTLTVEATAPEGTASISLILYSDIANTGTVLYDNVRLYDVTPEPAQTAQAPLNYATPGMRILADQYISPIDITVAEYELQAPALYDPLPVSAGPDTISTGPLHVGFSEIGLPTTLDFDRLRRGNLGPETRLFSDMQITVSSSKNDSPEQPEKLMYVADESGYELQNSYFNRRLARFGKDSQDRRLDVYTELIDNSMFLYMFPRLHLEQGETTWMTTSFHLDGSFRRVTYFEGNARTQSDLTEPVTLRLDQSVTKPFIMFERGGVGQPGIAFFLPVRPEVRAWYHEHYVAVAVPEVEVTIQPTDDGVDITFRAEGLTPTSDRPHTFDFYYWAFPVQGTPDTALYLLQGGLAPRIWANLPTFDDERVKLWTEFMPSSGDTRIFQALRYYPTEGYSFAPPDAFYRGLFTTMPESAHVWGNQTANYKRLNFSSSMDQAGMVYDMAVRHLQLYLDKADDVGIPPFRAVAAVWFEYFEGLSNYDLLKHFHFAQEPEYMVKTALNFVAAGKPSDEDAAAIASVVNRMMDLLDPHNTQRVPNTLVMPDGSYWYNYFEMETQRVWEGLADEPGFVNNVHITWLNVIADAARLNKLLGNDDAYNQWLEYFCKGVDGLIYIFNQERAWAEHDPNELLYGINWPGPNAGYAQYILSGWLPHIMEFGLEEADGYRVPELVSLFRKIMQGQWTRQGTYTGSLSSAQTWLNAYLHPKDDMAPVVEVLIAGERVGDGATLSSGSGLVLAATDDLSGVARVEYALGEGAWTAYSEPLQLPIGEVALQVRATDHAGNVASHVLNLRVE